jgi:SAM-dependent methyltransferase
VGEQKFDAYVDNYEAAVRESISFGGQEPEFYAQLKARHLLDVVARRIGPPAQASALDVGCGVGLVHRYLAPKLGALAGVDLAADAIARAQAENPGVDYRAYDGDRLPHDDASFDVVFAMGVVHHVPPAERATMTAELARVTAPAGLVVVFEHNPWNPLTRLAVSRCAFDDDAVLLSRGELRSLLARAGLEPVEARYIIFFPWSGERLRTIERRLGRLPLGAQHYSSAARPR